MSLYRNYLRIRDNISTVLLIPTLLGGIWQLLELSRMSPSFIRFFSVSQLIADGILISLILLIIYLLVIVYNVDSVFIGLISLRKRDFSEITKRHHFLVFILLIIASVFTYFNRNQLNVVYQTKTVTAGGLINLIPTVGMLFVFIYVTMFYIKFISNRLNFEKFNFELDKRYRYLFILMGIVFIGWGVSLVFHKSFTFPTNLKNMDFLNCRIKTSNNEAYEILYFNDNYIFVQFVDSSKVASIQVFDFESLMNSSPCDTIPNYGRQSR